MRVGTVIAVRGSKAHASAIHSHSCRADGRTDDVRRTTETTVSASSPSRINSTLSSARCFVRNSTMGPAPIVAPRRNHASCPFGYVTRIAHRPGVVIGRRSPLPPSAPARSSMRGLLGRASAITVPTRQIVVVVGHFVPSVRLHEHQVLDLAVGDRTPPLGGRGDPRVGQGPPHPVNEGVLPPEVLVVRLTLEVHLGQREPQLHRR